MNIPKYKLIYLEIVKLIADNKWPVGSFMKSEKELIDLFNVSRLTIRNVLSILENEFRIKRSRGKKTLILDRRLRSKFNSELKDRSVNLNFDYTIIDFNLVSNHLKNKFTSSRSLYFIQRTKRLKKEQIYLISRAYISKQIAGNIEISHVKKNKNLLDLLTRICRINWKKSNQELKAIDLSPEDAKIFNTANGIPALSNTWNFYDDKNNLVLVDEEIIIKPLRVQNIYY